MISSVLPPSANQSCLELWRLRCGPAGALSSGNQMRKPQMGPGRRTNHRQGKIVAAKNRWQSTSALGDNPELGRW